MSQNLAASRYQAVQVTTCSPARLVFMLLDGAIRFAEQSAAAFAAKDRGRAGERIARAHAIVAELLGTLDHAKAPELCDNLTAVYGFCLRTLTEANLKSNPALLAEVVRALTPLRDGWAGVLRAEEPGAGVVPTK